ncbi:MAG TPA: CHASE2 domain-containing protein [Candidatus Dormibacteraeota bacterium]|nr:CHASE2 domain-containing protein [Candidatus Dormibacteraeota bacterium]
MSALAKTLNRPLLIAAVFSILYIIFGDSFLVLRRVLELLRAEVPVSLDAVLASGSSALRIIPRHGGDVPLTLVDIDEALYASWGRPCITPRDRLRDLVQSVAARHPAAIVVDIDLSCMGSDRGLEAYLKSYRGTAPLILVRGMHVEPDPGDAVRLRVKMDPTPYDDAVAANPRISWGHALYLTDEDGTVRRWRESWEACTGSGTVTIPAVPLRILAMLPQTPGAAQRPRLLAHRGDCGLETQSSPEHLVVLGPRIIGQARVISDTGTPRVIPARQILNSSYAVEGGGYFALEGQVVIIGASHSGSGDYWRTALGYLPGMELLAHTARFAPILLTQAETGEWVHRLFVFLVFWGFVLLFHTFRSFWAFLLALLTIVGWILIMVGGYGRYEVFGSIESAIWLFVMYEPVIVITRVLCAAGDDEGKHWSCVIFLSDHLRACCKKAMERGR